MARVSKELPYHGKRGKVGNLVFRSPHGETSVQAAGHGPRKPRSAAQLAQTARFAQSRCYGKAQSDDPVAHALYAARTDQKYSSAYLVAGRDFLHPPEITALDASHYQGRPGDFIRVLATDDFEVVRVHLRILAPNGTLREAGPAALQADGCWHYSASQPGPVLPGTVVVAEARDRPGNVATAQQVL